MLPRDDPSAASVTVFIHPGSLGDILQAKGALVTASNDLRPGRVVLVTDASLRGLAESWGIFDDIIGFDPAHAYHGSVRTRVRTLIGLVRAIRSTAPTAVCVLKPSPIYGFIALMSGGRTGGLTRGIGHLLIGANQGVRDHEHREDRYLRAVRTVCAAAAPDHADYLWPWTNGLGHSMVAGGGYVVLAPGGARNVRGTMPERRWPSIAYAMVGRAVLQASPTTRVVLVGGPDDAREAEDVMTELGRECVDLVGQTTVDEARSIMGSARLVVCHDSGPMHLAASVGTPTVAIFGPTDPRVVCPRRPWVQWFWDPAQPGRPCHCEIDGSLRCTVQPCCIERVLPETVLSAVINAVEA